MKITWFVLWQWEVFLSSYFLPPNISRSALGGGEENGLSRDKAAPTLFRFTPKERTYSFLRRRNSVGGNDFLVIARMARAPDTSGHIKDLVRAGNKTKMQSLRQQPSDLDK